MRSLRLALRQTRPPIEIVVVDGSPNWQEGRERAEAVVKDACPLRFEPADRISSASQRNQAIRLAAGDVVFALDDDSLMYLDCAEEVMKVYEADRDGMVGGEQLHGWLVATRTFQRTHGDGDGTTGVDDDFAARGFANIGAWILGRNMFGPIRGAWPDDTWKGWWGDNPPYHSDVFVLTHHSRASIRMAGDTTFHFVTEGIHAALERAQAAAKGRDVRLGGGAATIQQYLRAGLIDEMHVAISPVVLGSCHPG